jgi:hypothetical protein
MGYPMEEEPDRIRRAGLRPSAEGGIPSLGRNQKGGHAVWQARNKSLKVGDNAKAGWA